MTTRFSIKQMLDRNNGLVPGCSNSIPNALELLQPCIKSSKYSIWNTYYTTWLEALWLPSWGDRIPQSIASSIRRCWLPHLTPEQIRRGPSHPTARRAAQPDMTTRNPHEKQRRSSPLENIMHLLNWGQHIRVLFCWDQSIDMWLLYYFARSYY